MLELEYSEVACPSCWETIELTLDLSAGSQTYTEDCPVCCQPMQVRLEIDDEGAFNLSVEAENA